MAEASWWTGNEEHGAVGASVTVDDEVLDFTEQDAHDFLGRTASEGEASSFASAGDRR